MKSKAINWVVMVVPIFTPKITPIAAKKDKIPASVRLATRTDAAVLDCKIAVETVPKTTPFTGLEVMEDKSSFIFEPECSLITLPKEITLNKNKATEKIIPKIIPNSFNI